MEISDIEIKMSIFMKNCTRYKKIYANIGKYMELYRNIKFQNENFNFSEFFLPIISKYK